jgi:L-fuculose-phosphate aldolase
VSGGGSERELRRQVAEVAHALAARGWVANHDGNVSVRLAPNRILATPGATAKAEVTAEALLMVSERGEKLAGAGAPFSELGLHLAIYGARPDARAVVHAHPPCATAIACAGGRQLERPFLAEAVVSLGPSIPTTSPAPPGADAGAALAPLVSTHDAVLLAHHGVITLGDSPSQALLRLELVEHLARIALEAEKIGGVRPLPDDWLPALAAARAKAGLGPGARAAAPPPAAVGPRAPAPVVACAPAPGADVAVIPPGRPRPAERDAPAQDLASIIREELARALADRR